MSLMSSTVRFGSASPSLNLTTRPGRSPTYNASSPNRVTMTVGASNIATSVSVTFTSAIAGVDPTVVVTVGCEADVVVVGSEVSTTTVGTDRASVSARSRPVAVEHDTTSNVPTANAAHARFMTLVS